MSVIKRLVTEARAQRDSNAKTMPEMARAHIRQEYPELLAVIDECDYPSIEPDRTECYTSPKGRVTWTILWEGSPIAWISVFIHTGHVEGVETGTRFSVPHLNRSENQDRERLARFLAQCVDIHVAARERDR